MQYFSLNSIKKLFQDYVSNEVNLKGYLFGEPFNINGEPVFKQVYPGMLVTPLSTGVDQYALSRQYQIIFYDILNEDSTNVIEVQSDCEEFSFRLIRFLREASDGFYTIGQPTVTPFVDRFFDDVAGVILNVSIEFNAQSEHCSDPNSAFPISSVDLPPYSNSMFIQGSSGSSGSSGQSGSSGSSGESGSSGSSGLSGSSGSSGQTGSSGSSGLSGSSGSSGQSGSSGSSGLSGSSGSSGESGSSGSSGESGSSGSSGLSGSSGSSGSSGLSGSSGSSGQSGSSGSSGESGVSGSSGSSGLSGSSGSSGNSGTSGTSGNRYDTLNYRGTASALGVGILQHNPIAQMVTTSFTLAANATHAGFFITGFVVDEPCTIDAIGMFGGGGNNFTASVAAGIYDAKTASITLGTTQSINNLSNLAYYPNNLLASATFSAVPPNSTEWIGSGLFFKTITPIQLQPNTPYFIGSYGTASQIGSTTTWTQGTLLPRPNLGFSSMSILNGSQVHFQNANSGFYQALTFSVAYPFTLATMSLPSVMPDNILTFINATPTSMRYLPIRIKSIP